MDGVIEFELKSDYRDVRDLLFYRLRRSVAYFLYNATICILAVVFAIDLPSFWERGGYVDLLFLTGMALIAPVLFAVAYAGYTYRQRLRCGRATLCFDQEGIVIKRNYSVSRESWGGITTISETEKYIFLMSGRHLHLVVYKNLVPTETLTALKELLAGVSVRTKKLM